MVSNKFNAHTKVNQFCEIQQFFKSSKKNPSKIEKLENMLDPVTNEIIYASNGCDEVHESEDTGNEDLNDDNNLKSNIRRRKGKIISCAKETIEQGKFSTFVININLVHKYSSK